MLDMPAEWAAPLSAFLLLSLALVSGVQAQEVTGRVLDGATEEPIATAEVALLAETGEPVALAVTDSAGWFRLRSAQPGVYRLEALGPGYEPLTVDSLRVDSGEGVAVELRLGARPFQMEAIEVLARRPMVSGPLRDYYWRVDQHRKTGRGIILDRAALVEYHGLSSMQVLGRQPFVKESRRGGPAAILLKNRRPGFIPTPYCTPAHYLDGLPVEATGILSIPVSDLEGIEVYRSGEVPAFFQRSRASGCGVILAWTRPG